MAQRNVSPETIKSYRDTFRIYLRYTETRCGVTPAKMSIAQFDADHILGFLSYLDKERGNSPKTVNSRLAALHSFVKYMVFELPSPVYAGYGLQEVPGGHGRYDALVATGATRMR